MRRNALEQTFLDEHFDVDRLNELDLFVFGPLQELLEVIAEDFENYSAPKCFGNRDAVGDRIMSMLWTVDHIVSYSRDLIQDHNKAWEETEKAKSSATASISPEAGP